MKTKKRHVFQLRAVRGEPYAKCKRCGVTHRIVFAPKHGALTIAVALYRAPGARHFTTERPACRA